MVGWLDRRADATPCPFRFPDVTQTVAALGLEPISDPVAGVASNGLAEIEPALKNLDESVLLALQHGLVREPVPLLGVEFERFETRCVQGGRGCLPAFRGVQAALTDQRQRQMGERRQISTGTDRATTGNHR